MVTQKCDECWIAGLLPECVDRQMTCQYGKCPTTKNLYLKGQFTKFKNTLPQLPQVISNNSIPRWFLVGKQELFCHGWCHCEQLSSGNYDRRRMWKNHETTTCFFDFSQQQLSGGSLSLITCPIETFENQHDITAVRSIYKLVRNNCVSGGRVSECRLSTS